MSLVLRYVTRQIGNLLVGFGCQLFLKKCQNSRPSGSFNLHSSIDVVYLCIAHIYSEGESDWQIHLFPLCNLWQCFNLRPSKFVSLPLLTASKIYCFKIMITSIFIWFTIVSNSCCNTIVFMSLYFILMGECGAHSTPLLCRLTKTNLKQRQFP